MLQRMKVYMNSPVSKTYAYRSKISRTSKIKRVILHDINLTSSSKKSDAIARWLKLQLLPTKKWARKGSYLFYSHIK